MSYCSGGELEMTETIQQLKEDIAILQEKLQKLEELEITKTPIEILEAYKRWRGEYPSTDNFDDWSAFRMGYHYSLEDSAIEAYVKRLKEAQLSTQKGNIKTLVEESVRWCEEHPDKDPLDWLKPQTLEQVADGLKEAFREAVKQGVVSSTKSPTLYDICQEWCDDDENPPVSVLIDRIDKWLPTEHDTNSYKWNECIRMIREKLR